MGGEVKGYSSFRCQDKFHESNTDHSTVLRPALVSTQLWWIIFLSLSLPGWFCVSAAWNPQPFDLDNYTSANCLCPASSTGGRCQAGFFCPAGSSEPIPCLPGAFCNAIGIFVFFFSFYTKSEEKLLTRLIISPWVTQVEFCFATHVV